MVIVMEWVAVADAVPLLVSAGLGLSIVFSADLKKVPSSIRKRFSPVNPDKFTLAPLGVAVKTTEELPDASPDLFVSLLPDFNFKTASVSASILPFTWADVDVP